MKNIKAGGRILSIIIALIIFSAAIAGMGAFIVDMGDTYGASENTSLATFSRMEEMETELVDLENRTMSGGVSFFEGIDMFFTGAYRALVTLFNIPGIVGGLVGDMAGASGGGLHIPSWAISMVIAIVSAVVILTIIGAIFRRDV